MSPASLESLASALGLVLSAEQTTSLSNYLALLQRWNGTYNLTAVRNPAEMLVQHVADCLAVVLPLKRQSPGGRLLDVGSGGGLPGLVIAAMLPEFDVSCIDTVGKKVAFIRQAAGALKLNNLHALHARVEALRQPAFDVITARAFASLADFTRLTRDSLATQGIWLAMKGRLPSDEIANLPPDIDVFHVEPLTVPSLGAQRCLVWMRPRPASAGN